MFENYLKIAVRNLRKYKSYSFINILGLAAGMACCILILLFVQHELRFDRFHENAANIYRLNVDYNTPNGSFRNALSSAPMAGSLSKNFPEVEQTVRFSTTRNPEILVSTADKQFYEEKFFYADAAVLKMFTFLLQQGDPETALRDPFSVLITGEIARKYFGAANPLGQTITLENDREYTVTGVMATLPETSHLQFNFLASFRSLEVLMGDNLESWTFNPFYTYVLLKPTTLISDLEGKFAKIVDDNMPEGVKAQGYSLVPNFQPLTDIHLHPQGNDLPGGINITFIYLFIAVAGLILLIACVNFMNLSTARSANRAKEVGLRKVVGARRKQLIAQFLGESILIALFSLILALVAVEVLLPIFNSIIGKSLDFPYLSHVPLLSGVLLLVILVGVIAGSYPAFLLSAFKPVNSVYGRLETAGKTPIRLRRLLVIFQFTVSIALIGGTIIVYQQIAYMKNKQLGFNKEQVLVVPLRDADILSKHEMIKTELKTQPGIVDVGMVQRPPGTGAWGTSVGREGAPQEEFTSMKYLHVDENFISALEIDLAAGRNFSKSFPADQEESFILNETAIRDLGWKNPQEAIGERIVWRRQPGTVVGVINDFHFQSLRIFMQPLVLKYDPTQALNLMVRISGENTPQTIAKIEEKWGTFVPNWPFAYSFLDQDLNNLYQAEERLGKIIGNFTILAVLIACLGLFGLAAFSAQRRTKEIGVRKVLGASIGSIIYLLSKEFSALVLAANIVAIPLAYYLIQEWLQNFSFKIDVNWLVFLAVAATTFLVAMLTISYQAVTAARANPVDALRNE